MEIGQIRDYVKKLNLDDWDLGGVEITEEDLYEIKSLIDAGSTINDAVDTCFCGIRNTLDAGLENEEE